MRKKQLVLGDSKQRFYFEYSKVAKIEYLSKKYFCAKYKYTNVNIKINKKQHRKSLIGLTTWDCPMEEDIHNIGHLKLHGFYRRKFCSCFFISPMKL